jgi:glycosyltransferase involved in cell wall biosynthesis
MPAIHQLLAGFSRGDAISNEALVMRRLFRSWGYASDIVCEPSLTHPDLRDAARDPASLPPSAWRPDDVALLHLSIGSTANERFAALPCRKALLYHNVTPAHYFAHVNKRVAWELDLGRRQVAALAGVAEVNLADSRFNARELEEAGYRDVKVLPLVLDLAALRGRRDQRLFHSLADGRCNVLFVGRGVPNKRIEDVIAAFAAFKRAVDRDARLIHVGSYVGSERYRAMLLLYARQLGVGDVEFAGAVPQAALNAYYGAASLFLCMSEHEGFCIPMIESLVHRVPVLAYAAGAVPETLDGAGILFREKNYPAIAEMMGRLCRDEPLRAAMLRRQDERLARYEARDLAAELRNLLSPVLPPIR